ncbi:hypothetical protein ACI68E_002044 [Malassezia pachydermatis]
MYVVAPALPAPYKWLNAPLNAISAEKWPGYFPRWHMGTNMGSYYATIPAELRDAFLRRASLRNSSQWTVAFLATATVVTSAMAIYYYALSNGYEINMNYLLSALHAQDFSLSSPFMSGFMDDADEHVLSSDDHDDEDDDDEHVDPELMDGFDGAVKRGKMNVLLVSSDPSSELCRTPIKLDLSKGETTWVGSSESSPTRRPSILKRDSQVFPSRLLCDPRSLEELPRHRRRMARHAVNSPWECLSPTPLALQTMAQEDGEKVGMDEVAMLRAGSECTSPSETMKRSIMITEPNWAPFADTHDRARQRAVVAVLAKSLGSISPGTATPSSHAEEMAKEILMRTLPTEPTEELGNGSEFWFERFTRSTAAAGKRWDFRRRASEPAEHFNSDVFDALLRSAKDECYGTSGTASPDYAVPTQSSRVNETISMSPRAHRTTSLSRSSSMPSDDGPKLLRAKRKLGLHLEEEKNFEDSERMRQSALLEPRHIRFDGFLSPRGKKTFEELKLHSRNGPHAGAFKHHKV